MLVAERIKKTEYYEVISIATDDYVDTYYFITSERPEYDGALGLVGFYRTREYTTERQEIVFYPYEDDAQVAGTLRQTLLSFLGETK